MNRAQGDSHYGNIGKTTYDQNERDWHFLSALRHRPSLAPLTDVETLVAPSHHNLPPLGPGRSKTGQLTDQLTDKVPEYGSVGFLTDRVFPPTDGKAVHFDFLHDHLVSNLAGFCDTWTWDLKKRLPLFASATGDTRSTLLLIQAQRRRFHWDHDPPLNLDSLELDERDACTWDAGRGIILQVCFANTSETSLSFLAVRYHTCISILQPVVGQSLKSRQRSRSLAPQVKINHVVDVFSSEDGRIPFTDVAFNPWHQRLLAAVDVYGQWYVWEIKSMHNAKIHLIRKGCLKQSASWEGQRTYRHFEDWHQVIWLSNPKYLLIADRNELQVFNIKTRTPEQTKSTLELHEEEVILDVQHIPEVEDQVCVLTNTHAHHLKVQFISELVDSIQNNVSFRTLVVLRHDRDSRDRSLRAAIRKNYACK